jgi:hypothetical protein
MRTYFRPIIDSRTTTPTNNYFQNGIVGEGLMYEWFADSGYTHIGEQLKAWGDFLYANQTAYVWGSYILQCCWLLNGFTVLRELYPADNNYKVLSDSIWKWYILNGEAATARAKFYNEQYRGPAHFLKYLLADPNYLSKYPDYLNSTGVENARVRDIPSGFLSVSPNPCTGGQVAIKLSHVQGEVVIYDLAGREVWRMDSRQTLAWDGCDKSGRSIGSGVYLIRWKDQGKLIAKQRLFVLR